MPTVPVILVHVIEQLGQIRKINIKRHVLPHIVDQPRHLGVVAEVILDDVAVAEVLDVPGCVHEAIQESSVGGKVLGGAVVALLERHTVE